MISRNAQGEYALYDQGRLVGFAPVKFINGVRVVSSMYDRIKAMQTAAAKDNIKLRLAAGLRTWDEQMHLRIKNIIDKSKEHDLDYLSKADSGEFKPRTGKPGFSNHQDGKV